MPSQTIHFPTEQYRTIDNYAAEHDLTFSKAVQELTHKGVEFDLKRRQGKRMVEVNDDD